MKMVKKEVKRNLVELTNDSSILSKASMSRKGYVQDDYLKYFVGDDQRSRAPLIHRGYYVRHKAIEYGIKAAKCNIIITLGCGFDTSPFRNLQIRFIEIDFPDVAIRKARVIRENQLLTKRLDTVLPDGIENISTPQIVLNTGNYCLIGADLRNPQLVVKLLSYEKLLPAEESADVRVGLLNECSLCYLSEEDGNNVILALVTALNRFNLVYIGYEMIKSPATNDEFSQVMFRHFKAVGAPLKTLLRKEEIVKRFQKLGFDKIDPLVDMKTFWFKFLSEEERRRIQSLEPFDEYEEFHLLCTNYALTIAERNIAFADQRPLAIDSITSDDCPIVTSSCNSSDFLNLNVKEAPAEFHRFAHTSCLCGSNLYVFGGFGCDTKHGSRHRRLNDLLSVNLTTMDIRRSEDVPLTALMYSQLVSLTDDLMLVSGGRTSPSKLPFGALLLKNDFVTSNVMEATNSDCGNHVQTWRHSVVSCRPGQAVLIGGLSHDIVDGFHVFDVNRNEWNQVRCPNLNSLRHSHSCAPVDTNTVLLSGGLRTDSNSLLTSADHLRLLDLRDHNCQSLKNLPSIYSHTSHYLNNALYIVGGIIDSGSHNAVLKYDIRNQSIVSEFHLDSTLKTMLHNHSSVMYNNEIRIYGGGGNCFSFGTHLNKFILQLSVR